MGQSVVMKTKTVALTPGAGARGSTRRPSRSRTRRGPADVGRPIITLAITTASTTQTVTALARDIVQPSTEPDASIQSGTVKLTRTRASPEARRPSRLLVKTKLASHRTGERFAQEMRYVFRYSRFER